jgi:hypothetical protein
MSMNDNPMQKVVGTEDNWLIDYYRETERNSNSGDMVSSPTHTKDTENTVTMEINSNMGQVDFISIIE